MSVHAAFIFVLLMGAAVMLIVVATLAGSSSVGDNHDIHEWNPERGEWESEEAICRGGSTDVSSPSRDVDG